MIGAVILLIVGLLAIFLEFYLPGGIFGTAGALLVVGAVVIFALDSESILLTLLFLIGASAGIGIVIRFALWKIRHGKVGYSVYSESDQEGYVASSWDRELLNREGKVATDLRPSGHITIDGKTYSAVSQSGYIEKGLPVIVTGGEGETLIVRKHETSQFQA